MNLLAAALAALSVAACWPVSGRASARRLGRLLPAPPPTESGSAALTSTGSTSTTAAGRRPPSRRSRSRPGKAAVGDDAAATGTLARPRVRWAACALAGAAVAATVGGAIGLAVGLVAALVLDRAVVRVEPVEVRRRRARLFADLPLAADLLAAALLAGRPADRSVEAVARALDGPLARELALVAASLRLGADARTAWSAFCADPALAPVGRAMVRAWDGGAPLAPTLRRVAADARAVHRAAARDAAQAVGVKAAAPLGLCFLPAFLLIGVVPAVAAAVTDVLG